MADVGVTTRDKRRRARTSSTSSMKLQNPRFVAPLLMQTSAINLPNVRKESVSKEGATDELKELVARSNGLVGFSELVRSDLQTSGDPYPRTAHYRSTRAQKKAITLKKGGRRRARRIVFGRGERLSEKAACIRCEAASRSGTSFPVDLGVSHPNDCFSRRLNRVCLIPLFGGKPLSSSFGKSFQRSGEPYHR